VVQAAGVWVDAGLIWLGFVFSLSNRTEGISSDMDRKMSLTKVEEMFLDQLMIKARDQLCDS
jgi:hypothetical protein